MAICFLLIEQCVSRLLVGFIEPLKNYDKDAYINTVWVFPLFLKYPYGIKDSFSAAVAVTSCKKAEQAAIIVRVREGWDNELFVDIEAEMGPCCQYQKRISMVVAATNSRRVRPIYEGKPIEWIVPLSHHKAIFALAIELQGIKRLAEGAETEYQSVDIAA
jgi:hypothetical protein